MGVGYSRIYGIDPPPAREACLTVGDLDRVIAEVQAMTGSGSATRRKQILGEVIGRATSHEADCVGRLFTGELRQGALVGLMVEAIANAAGVSGALARRALMLWGDSMRTAEHLRSWECGLQGALTGGRRWPHCGNARARRG